jgi:hypothetical protein
LELTSTTDLSSSTTISSTTAPSTRTFTRPRPGNNNDGAHVEQTNWTHVRELVGYLRFDTPRQLAISNEIWALDMVFTNYLPARQKIVFKQRNGSKVTERYDRATTPFARSAARASIDGDARQAMQEAMDAIRPGELFRQIHELTTQLERIALAKATAPVKPRVNRAPNPSLHPEVLPEATTQTSRRITCEATGAGRRHPCCTKRRSPPT